MDMNTERPDQIVALLERIGRLLAVDAHADGLLPVHWETLRYLARANRFSLTAAALTAYLGLTKGTVSQSLNSLAAKGLVTKQENRNDRRSKRLSLTRKGRGQLQRDPQAAMAAAISQLDSMSAQQLVTSLEALLTARLAARGRQPFGQCRDCRYFARQHPEGGPHYCKLLNEKLAQSDIDAICFEQLPA